MTAKAKEKNTRKKFRDQVATEKRRWGDITHRPSGRRLAVQFHSNNTV